MFFSLKKYSKLEESESTKLQELFNLLTETNQSILLNSIVGGLIFFLLTAPFIYQLYCASTWKNVQPYEYIRIVGVDFVKTLLSRQ